MGHDDKSSPDAFLNIHQFALGILMQFFVQRGQRFIQKQQLEPSAKAMRWRWPPEIWSGLRRAAAAQATREMSQTLRCGNSAAYKYHIDRTPMWQAGNDVAPVQMDLALGRGIEPGQHPHHRGLGATRGAKQRKEFARIDRQIRTLDRGE
nr:hypothetical protein [Paracoccus litorisediminis]